MALFQYVFLAVLPFTITSDIPQGRKPQPIFVAKCCKGHDIFIDGECGPLNKTEETAWVPTFRNKEGQIVHPDYKILTDIPACENRLDSIVFHRHTDRLILLPDGTLRHYIVTNSEQDDILDEELNEEILHYDYKLGYYCIEKLSTGTPYLSKYQGQKVHPDYKILTDISACENRLDSIVFHRHTDRLMLLPDGTLRHYIVTNSEQDDILNEELNEEILHYDYKLGYYCIEKFIDQSTGNVFQYAILCPPKVSKSWSDLDFVLRKIVDPIFHIIAIICYLTGAIVHFVLPQLRDMVGNIITTLCICLVIAQAADTCRIFTEFTSPIGFLIADIVMFISLVGAYFWLNSLGFYIWKTFRSQNVFLRMTDGRKYCIYSYWVWSWTIILSLLAMFSHFTLDVDSSLKKPESPITQALGWLGIGVFFSPIACTILANIYFYLSTLQVIGTVSRYGGRIHHKLKHCFETFLKIFIIMVVSWLFLLLSWLPYASMYYCYIFVNALEAPLILYISVLSQRRVRFLLRKVCCFEKCVCHCCRPNQPNDIPEWGEEMMAMNR